MLYAFVSILCLIDLLFLKVMPKFYFSVGIPIYKGFIDIKQNKTLKDIGVYIGISEELVYKIKDNKLLFRTKFKYSNLYRVGFLSIIKGEVKIIDSKAYIIQRVNLTTLYFALLVIFILFTEKIDVIGYIILGVILVITLLFHLARNTQIEEIRKDAEININQEKKLHSRWGD